MVLANTEVVTVTGSHQTVEILQTHTRHSSLHLTYGPPIAEAEGTEMDSE
jgi:hypothetical protein